jgi:excinuclease ABC subunit B
MYADRITDSMQATMDETLRRRKKQIEYNYEHKITPIQAGRKKIADASLGVMEVTAGGKLVKAYIENETLDLAADPVFQYMSAEELRKQITKAKSAMIKAAKEMNFVEAARLRDEMYSLEKLLGDKEGI